MRTRGYLSRELECGGARFCWGSRTYVMGIINVSPNSFSGDGLEDVDAAVEQGRRFVEEGADILDVGGESTRPASTARVERRKFGAAGGRQAELLNTDEEVRRVVPVIRRLREEVGVPISVDTYKAEVALQAVDAGAAMINDVWGLKAEPELGRVAADRQVALVLTHNQRGTGYTELLRDIDAGLGHSVELAAANGVPRARIILDPGFGFGKTPQHNLELLRRLGELGELGYPLLTGTSRKSTIGLVLDAPANDRVEGTAATVAISIANGADIVRVHDVKAMVRVARMTDAIVRGWEPREG